MNPFANMILTQGLNLQQACSGSTASNEVFTGGPHHPITCSGELFFEQDGAFRCEHSIASADDPRTKQAVNHSIAILLIELALEL